MIAGNTDRVILEYSDFETTDTPFPDSSEASVRIKENDVPEVEAVDLSKIIPKKFDGKIHSIYAEEKEN